MIRAGSSSLRSSASASSLARSRPSWTWMNRRFRTGPPAPPRPAEGTRLPRAGRRARGGRLPRDDLGGGPPLLAILVVEEDLQEGGTRRRCPPRRAGRPSRRSRSRGRNDPVRPRKSHETGEVLMVGERQRRVGPKSPPCHAPGAASPPRGFGLGEDVPRPAIPGMRLCEARPARRRDRRINLGRTSGDPAPIDSGRNAGRSSRRIAATDSTCHVVEIWTPSRLDTRSGERSGGQRRPCP